MTKTVSRRRTDLNLIELAQVLETINNLNFPVRHCVPQHKRDIDEQSIFAAYAAAEEGSGHLAE